MSLTAAEQYLLELINRARLDPQAEADRFGIALNDELPAGTIDASAKQVLAPNALLEAAAEGHSDWMLANNRFTHDYADPGAPKGTNTPGHRMDEAGYVFSGSWTWGENIAMYSVWPLGSLDLEQAMTLHYNGLFESAGHRKNTLAEDFREIGISQVRGNYTDGRVWDTSMLTENFAKSGNAVFVTGVVFDDTDEDAFYSIGEGRAGATISAGGITDATTSTGGYAIGLAPSADRLVTITHSDGLDGALRLDMSQGNAKLDYIEGGEVLTSVSAELVSGIDDIRLLGVADLDLAGDDGDNRLTGNKGDNTLLGGAGNDTLDGGAGADTLDGGDGSDVYIVDGFDIVADTGATGQDRLVVSGDTDHDLDLALMGIEHVETGGGNDSVDASLGSVGVMIVTGSGHDHAMGGAGGDYLSGGSASTFDLALAMAGGHAVRQGIEADADTDLFALL